MGEESRGVLVWWGALSMIGVVNISLWAWSAARLARLRPLFSADEHAWWRRQSLLSAGYVFGCAFRSFLPRADVQRICLYDSWLSSVMLGRSVATVAELCFIMQLSLHLRRLAVEHGSPVALALSRTVFPLIVVAETCSWYAVVSTNYLGNSCEESLWAVSGVLLLAGCAAVWPRCDARRRRQLLLPFVAAPLYVAFMAFVDVPMYLARWRADRLAGHRIFPLLEGFRDLAHRWVVTRSWSDWSTEMPWMTLYFSLAVWISIALATPSRQGSQER
jgi:hypothetical protein